jgi:hypothetical protein
MTMNATNITPRKLFFIISLALALAANSYFYLSKDDAPEKSASQSLANAALIKIGEKCLDFGERAVAKDTPIIEFQMLAREAKKANVVNTCMTDNGYIQNPAWSKYAQPIVAANAQKNNTSSDEAFANLSRKHMQVFSPVAERPDYWVKK